VEHTRRGKGNLLVPEIASQLWGGEVQTTVKAYSKWFGITLGGFRWDVSEPALSNSGSFHQ
jgi:hypothetical protein